MSNGQPKPCRPGTVISIEDAQAVISLFFEKNGTFYAVTAGHECAGKTGKLVQYFSDGVLFDLGTVDGAVFDATDDVGVIRVTQSGRVGEAPESNFTLGSPQPPDQLSAVVSRSCRIYYGHQPRTDGVVKKALSNARTEVTAFSLGFAGESGSPLYVDQPSGWRLVGQYLGPADEPLRMRFQHPGPGLARLGH